jgi:hypothetical protein
MMLFGAKLFLGGSIYLCWDDEMKDDPIALVLDDLLKLDDILACMVARRNMISVMPSGDGFKPEVNQIWDIIKRAMDDVFSVVGQYSAAGLGEMEFRLQEYEVLFYVFPDTENALVAIVPALANKGLIEVELENARREILAWMAKKDEPSEQKKDGPSEVMIPA